jgi:MoxR-like ATPase
MAHYLPRTLTYFDGSGRSHTINEADVASLDRPIVVLGEPGMGKTELLRQISYLTNSTFRSATSFVSHPRPRDLVSPGDLLIIGENRNIKPFEFAS